MPVCDRPYMSSAPLDDCASEEHCYACDGWGFKLWFNADSEADESLACDACEGIATAGLFVVQIVAGKFRYEVRDFETPNLSRAERRAGSAARHVRRLTFLGVSEPATEVRIVFKANGFPDVVAAEVII